MIFHTLSIVAILSSLILGLQFRLDGGFQTQAMAETARQLNAIPSDSAFKGLSDSLSVLTGSKSTGVQTARFSKTKFKWMRFKFWIHRNQERLLYTVVGSPIVAVLFNIWVENRRVRRRQ